jgi:hypothetical protein
MFSSTYIVPLTDLNVCACVLESVILCLLPCYLYVVMRDLEQLIGLPHGLGRPCQLRSEFPSHLQEKEEEGKKQKLNFHF